MKCTFCGVSHDSVENAEKSIQNGKSDNFDPHPGGRAPVSLDTECSFGRFAHKSVQNAQKAIQNGMTNILNPPPLRTQLSFTMPFQMKVLEMHRKQSTPSPSVTVKPCSQLEAIGYI